MYKDEITKFNKKKAIHLHFGTVKDFVFGKNIEKSECKSL